MEARYLVAFLIVCLAGCQTGGNTELMERELRLQEDRIYYLEDELARCCEAMQNLQAQGVATPAGTSAPLPARRPAAPPSNVPPDAIPQVELELPGEPATPGSPLPVPGPAPNGLPNLFEPTSTDAEPTGTAMRIVRPETTTSVAVAPSKPTAPSDKPSNSPRMRFASAVQEPPSRERPSRTVVEWSQAAPASKSEELAEPITVGAAPRRPQWSPYR